MVAANTHQTFSAQYWHWKGRMLALDLASDHLQFTPMHAAYGADDETVSVQHNITHIHSVVDRIMQQAFPAYWAAPEFSSTVVMPAGRGEPLEDTQYYDKVKVNAKLKNLLSQTTAKKRGPKNDAERVKDLERKIADLEHMMRTEEPAEY
ncbi:hypothetical protein B0T11DRAFT_325267 [Plectosphaerella cucumerina]|uniref:Uncharacterized protein n=1 Tax=Plectosphaerella cucumerina TaxID=40658 RepID=A0A8K0TH47_9PEZI|nr:hypothetical protein B0T11DRAFT_325267 [Plectosphaerella cucumerina]